MSAHRPFTMWIVADDHPIAGQLAKARGGAIRVGAAATDVALLLGMPSPNAGEVRDTFSRVSRAAADAIGVPVFDAVGLRRRCTPRGTAARRAVVYVLREAGWSWKFIARQIGCDRTTAMGCHRAAEALQTTDPEFAAIVATTMRAVKPVDGVASI